MQRLSPSKKGKDVQATVLSAFPDWIVDFVQEKRKKYLIPSGFNFTHLVSSLNLNWYDKTWSTKIQKRFQKLDCLYAPKGSWAVYKWQLTNSWASVEPASPVKSLPQT